MISAAAASKLQLVASRADFQLCTTASAPVLLALHLQAVPVFHYVFSHPSSPTPRLLVLSAVFACLFVPMSRRHYLGPNTVRSQSAHQQVQGQQSMACELSFCTNDNLCVIIRGKLHSTACWGGSLGVGPQGRAAGGAHA